jgi:hypothetical protein
LDQKFGYVTPGNVKTDDSGRAEFTYNVSDGIVQMVGSSTTVDLVYINNDRTDRLTVQIRVVPAPDTNNTP